MGALSGLLAGAVAGGAQAVQQNAQGDIEEKRKRALMSLEQGMFMDRQKDSQQFQASERGATETFQTGRDETLQGYEQSNARLTHGLNMDQERYRQGQQNSRANAQQNDWETIRLSDGSIGRYNPQTGDYEKTELPGTALMGDEGDLSDVEKKRFDLLSDDIDAIRERAAYEARDLTKDEVEILGGYINDRNAILGSGGSGGSGEQTILEKLLAGEGGDTGGTGEGGSGGTDAPGGNNQTESVRGLLSSADEQGQKSQAQYEKTRAASDAFKNLDKAIQSATREIKSGQSTGGLIAQRFDESRGQQGKVSEKSIQEAKAAVEDLLALDAKGGLNELQVKDAAKAVKRLRDLGVTINIPKQ